MIASINPATGETLRTFEPLTASQLEEKLALAETAWRDYRRTSFSERALWLREAARILDDEQDRIGRIATEEMGKTIGSARAEAVKCALGCRYYADHGEQFLADEAVEAPPGRSLIRYQPVGPVLAIMPWNFPFWQVFRFAAPALMAGNVALLKHSSNVPQCALEIEDIFRRSGFPAGAFQTLLIGSKEVGRVIEDSRIKAASLTGSESAGAQVACQAGKSIKKTVLELGGSDPFIVMPSANLERTAEAAAEARCINNGQSCIAAKRFIVDESIASRFEASFVKAMAARRVGDPMDEAVQLGPLATPDILQDLDKQVRESVAMGARVLTGGHRLDLPGNYYAPTVLTDVPKESPAYRDEMFGPVAVLLRARGVDDAIRIANDTGFGLGASAWTEDPAEQDLFTREIEAGMVFINTAVASDPRLPFGGIKRSGYGRELGVYGIREFVNVKTVKLAS